MKRPAFKFRVQVEGTRFVRVTVAEDKAEMWKALEKCHGERHRHEVAACVYAPNSPDHGCIADLFFFWRCVARPAVVAHEATHAAAAILIALKKSFELGTDDEVMAYWVEKLTEKILARTGMAPL